MAGLVVIKLGFSSLNKLPDGKSSCFKLKLCIFKQAVSNLDCSAQPGHSFGVWNWPGYRVLG